MNVTSIAGLPAISPGTNAAAPAPFTNLFHDAIRHVQDLEGEAATAVTGLLRGDGVDIHEAMIATQKADLAFELALAVRSKAVAAYQTMMGLQF